MAAVSDIDGDGFTDLAVGARDETAPGAPGASGVVYVYSGRDGHRLYLLQSPTPIIFGSFGFAICAFRDLDGDGVGDLAVGVREEGRVHVFSGAEGTLLYTVTFSTPRGGYFGEAVAALPDADGDGIEDFIVASSGENREQGTAYVFSGASGQEMYRIPPPYPEQTYRFGVHVAGVPDTDGDGRGDVLIGAPLEDPPGPPGPLEGGRAYLFSGATGALLYPINSPIVPAQGFSIALAGVPDIDGDGRGDLVIGSPNQVPPGATTRVGALTVFSGATGAVLYTLTSPVTAPIPQNWAYFGGFVASVSDIDWDSVGDLIVFSSESQWPSVPIQSGTAYLFSGRTGSLLRRFVSPRPEEYAGFGAKAVCLPRANSDALPDLAISAPGECSGNCPPDAAGVVYVFHSCPTDYNADGLHTTADIFNFLISWFGRMSRADFNGNGVVSVQDLFEFIASWFQGCP